MLVAHFNELSQLTPAYTHKALNSDEHVLKAYKGYPYFAHIEEWEYDGTTFEDCPIVLQFYPKVSYKEAASPFLWSTICAALMQSDMPRESFHLLLAGKSKVRLGFKSYETAQSWFETVKFDLETQGILSKDERSNKHASNMTESTASSRSSANSSYGPYQPDCDTMVMYDVLVWMEDNHLIEAFKAKQKSIVRATRLNWTLGDISLAAWKIGGQQLKELSGSIIRDPHRKRPM